MSSGRKTKGKIGRRYFPFGRTLCLCVDRSFATDKTDFVPSVFIVYDIIPCSHSARSCPAVFPQGDTTTVILAASAASQIISSRWAGFLRRVGSQRIWSDNSGRGRIESLLSDRNKNIQAGQWPCLNVGWRVCLSHFDAGLCLDVALVVYDLQP